MAYYETLSDYFANKYSQLLVVSLSADKRFFLRIRILRDHFLYEFSTAFSLLRNYI